MIITLINFLNLTNLKVSDYNPDKITHLCQSLFKEFCLFSKTENGFNYWDPYSKEPRILGALFMAEICRPAAKKHKK